ncbi:hypothetical protein SCATT_35140 [Streptantibioticus cattleyicolor NRRL 8057 = DSM 46488]|uniref:Uncharacterized protein n=1 Tax=Streptantibioticus cattleyicolor (strain ATCC 35852 / DSM 46488 / JCM 4925 / NBRC 14057 / NRRL 8057) TaxID=1003195 RepID=G8WUJ6_STREN|nr:hypothetical protein SCATT_35140 [Streptantibioticus cattleyicolor NRRL 8057 = DSM 46488]
MAASPCVTRVTDDGQPASPVTDPLRPASPESADQGGG